MTITRKHVVASFEPSGERTYKFVASDATVDRYGDTIDAKGWELADFRANPVILFGHDSKDLPIGKSVREWVEDGKLKIEVKFTSEEENPKGAQVERLIKGGFLNAVSVGFKPLEAKEAKERSGSGFFPAMDFTKQQLLEVSVVPIPANPNALLEGKAAPEDVALLRAWAERTLEAVNGEPGAWVTRSVARALPPPVEVVEPAVETKPEVEQPAAVEPVEAVEAEKDLSPAEIAALVKAFIETESDKDRTARMQRTGRLD